MTIKTKLLIVLAVVFQPAFLLAQNSQSVLWEVSGNGVKKPSYIFGTVHVAPISVLDSFPKVMSTAKKCDFAIFESGGRHIGNIPAPVETRQPPLDSLFTPQEYALVDSFFTASPHGSMRPHNDDADLLAMLQIAITMNQKYQEKQYDPFDVLVWEKLKNMDKLVFQLDDQADIETIKDVMGYRRMAEILVYVVRQKDSLQKLVSQESLDLDLYTGSLTAALNLDQKADKDMQKATTERNLKWIPKIEHQMHEGSCFVAVGLFHLKFETGLIQLLRNKGYTVTAVNL